MMLQFSLFIFFSTVFGSNPHSSRSLCFQGQNGVTPLMAASAGGHTDMVRLLFQHGADANRRTTAFGMTALMHACRGAHTETVRVSKWGGGCVCVCVCVCTFLNLFRAGVFYSANKFFERKIKY